MTGNETRLGPDDLIGREFAIGLRGYDRDEVDAFLLRAAEAWRETMSAAPAVNGLTSSAMAALTGSEAPSLDDVAPPADVPAPADGPVVADPFSGPAPVDPFAAPTAPTADPFAEPVAPAPPADEVEPFAEPVAPTPEPVAEFPPPAVEPEPVAAPEPVAEAPAGPPPSRSEVERDRATAYAERVAAELDRASARTELAQAQEEALKVVDTAQRRAEAVLTGARARAQAEAEAILEDARTRLTPLLEQERAVRARLVRLRQELDGLTADDPTTAAPALPDAASLVTSAEDDPSTPEPTFPVGYGSVSINS